MAVVVDGRPTGVHTNFVVLKWTKLLHPGRHSVKEPKSHMKWNAKCKPIILGGREKGGQ
jgi:hypothetical protein